MTQLNSASQQAEMIPLYPSRLKSLLWWFMLLSCAGVAVYSTRYFLLPVDDQHFSRFILPLRLHIAGGMGALLAGPWQFSTKLRSRALSFHRWLGRFYLVEVALGSIAGFAMSTVSEEGLLTHLGFGTLAVLWFLTGFEAYRKIRQGNIEEHRKWMIRNFSLTLAAVTLRNWMPLMLFALHWPFHITYITVSWLCWVPNLLVAEWLVRRKKSVQFV